MTTEELLARLEGLGLTVVLGSDGRPALKGPAAQVTPAVQAALKWHRAPIIELLKARRDVAAAADLAAPGKPSRMPPDVPPLNRRAFRERLERFWDETGWTPVGGWKPGERDPRHD